MKATLPSGDLREIANCYIDTPYGRIVMKILPEISDSKSARYSDETIIGRSFPMKTYSHSENRSISWTAHFMVIKEGDQEVIMNNLRLIESLTYPVTVNTNGAPYSPPAICKLRCGDFIATQEVCAVLLDYSTKAPTDAIWYERRGTLFPSKLDVDMKWEVVYDSTDLPGQNRIMNLGR